MRVLVAEAVAEEGIDLLRAEHDVDVRVGLSREELLAALPEYDGLLVRSQVKVDAEAIAAGRGLVVIGRAGVGVDNIDLSAATAAGVIVVNAPTGNTIAAAEHTLALLFSLARWVPAADASMHRGDWKRSDFVGRELDGRTLGVIGLGKIGMAVADRARALGMQVVGHDPFVTPAAASLHGIRSLSLSEILSTADAVTVHVPLTRDTRGLIGGEQLALMPAHAFVINVARGGVVDEAALAEALAQGRLAGAAVDVFSTEPPAADHPLRSAPNAILTPHLGASTEEAQTRVAVEAAEQVRDVLAGRPARYAVNAPLLTPETAAALAPYLPLARTLGQFYAQLATDLSGVTLEVAGELASFDTTALVASALGGILETHTEERVNVVNAHAVAKARGLTVVERKTPDAGRYASLLTLSGSTSVAGTVAAGEPRLVNLEGHAMDLAPAPFMLISRHRDRPGTIGMVGGALGESDVNISAMHLARSEPRADAFIDPRARRPGPQRGRGPHPLVRRGPRRVAHHAGVTPGRASARPRVALGLRPEAPGLRPEAGGCGRSRRCGEPTRRGGPNEARRAAGDPGAADRMKPAERPEALPAVPSLLALVRHGESTWLTESRFQGRGDPPLTDLGRRQAQAVGARLAAPGAPPALPLPPDAPIAIYHSPLVRAADTARAIHAARGGDSPLVAVAELTEIAQGRWEGLTHDEVRERYADELAAWRRDPTRHHAPEGEPLAVAAERARVAARSILASGAREMVSVSPGAPAPDDEGQPPEPVLGYERRYGSPEQARRTDWAIVVAHDGLLRLLMLDLLRVDIAGFWSYPFALAAVTVLDRSGGLVRLRAHNLDEHITALTR